MLKLFCHLYLLLNLSCRFICLGFLASPLLFFVPTVTLADDNIEKILPVNLQPLNWQLSKTSDTLSIEFRNIPHSDVIEIRAKALIESTLSGALLFLQDTKSISKWLHNSSKSKIIKNISATENISVTTFDAFWLFKNREMIIRSRYWQNDDLSVEVTINDESKNYSQYKSKETIQINIISAHWTIKKRSNGMIEIEHTVSAEPNGFIPNWLAIRIALKSMWKTLVNIENQLPSSGHQKQQLPNILEHINH
jgi:hypothetical protein